MPLRRRYGLWITFLYAGGKRTPRQAGRNVVSGTDLRRVLDQFARPIEDQGISPLQNRQR